MTERLITRDEWTPTALFVFRLLVIYTAMYMLSHLWVIPVVGYLVRFVWELPWQALVPAVGKEFFGVEITALPGGSGDTTYNWVQVVIMLVMATVGAAGWTAWDRRGWRQREQVWAFITAIRYYLFFALFTYGIVKVIKTQFPDVPLRRLIQPYGESSPMGLLWTFMGFSTAYNYFTGAIEILGGLLMLNRRTVLLGALVSAGTMAQVLMLNMAYDVPVKLYSAHLLLFAGILILPRIDRLSAFFLRNGPAEPEPLWTPLGVGLQRVVRFAKWGVAVLAIGFSVFTALQTRARVLERPPLYGLYTVSSMHANGREIPPLVTDSTRWHHLVVERRGNADLWLLDGTRQIVSFEADTSAGRVAMRTRTRTEGLDTLAFRIPHEDSLVLEGILAGDSLLVRFSRRDASDFLLTGRGFHWINETPFNR